MAVRTLSLCAGVAGIDLGLRLAEPDSRTVCYVEWSPFPAAVIAARIADQTLDDAPCWDDVGTFDGRPWRGVVDLVTAGFPCQPVSLAGKRLGMADERFIWGDVARIIGEVGPARVLLENVPGILSADDGRFLGRVLGDLADLGYDTEWDLFSAEETGAPHRRQRWFCLGISASARRATGEPCTSGAIRDEAWRAQSGGRGSDRDLAHDSRSSRSSDIAAGEGESRLSGVPSRLDPTLADAPGDLRGPSGDDRRIASDGAGNRTVGDADSSGREEQCRPVAVRPEQSSAERAIDHVGHAPGGTRQRPAPGHSGHAAFTGEDDELDYPEGSGMRRSGESERSGPIMAVTGSHRVYPPARNDRAGWQAVDPSLEPAICRDADGLASGLDPALFAYRADRLRAVGNGVVPLTAALAWIELNRRFGD